MHVALIADATAVVVSITAVAWITVIARRVTRAVANVDRTVAALERSFLLGMYAESFDHQHPSQFVGPQLRSVQ